MTPQERSLIQSVFDRLARLAGAPKDPEADALIQASMRQNPDAGYQLVEAVVVQEQALNDAQARIADLERQIAALQAARQPQAPAPSGGLFSGLNPFGRSRVPQTPPAPPAYPQQAYPQQPGYPPQPGYPQQPGYGQPSPWGAPSAGGSFLRTAAGTAVGVAGGVLLAESISNMFGGHAANAANVASAAGAEHLGAPVSYDTQVADQGGYDPSGDFGVDAGGDVGYDDGGFDDSSF
ncbi:MAG: hypothetical protein RLZZ501_2320 [Pseudomonadota bacterium]|jgi:hypothetical protein